MHIVMVRHGRIDASDEELLCQGNPHLDEDWAEENLPRVGEQLKGIRFAALYCGNLNRNVETLQALITSSDLPVVWIEDEFLDDPSTWHEGVIYPDIRPSFLAIMLDIPGHLRDIAKSHGQEAIVLMVGGAAEIISMMAISRGLKFRDEEEIQRWMSGESRNQTDGVVETGEVRVFTFDPQSCAVRQSSLEEARCV